ncbi:Stealth CR1 domain-containing protein [bacterium]|nr:Stealth CR1 domain-containing protein [bacterium]
MEKIDLVYLWVDDADKEWVRKKNLYLNNNESFDSDAVDDCRFNNNDELKYSLRSVEKYANWINKIFIVTDNQIPSWLDTSNPRIRIVNHSEIIPQDKLPLFNSCAIEARIPFIKDLSEYFLYANDDTFFWREVEKDFFFRDGKIICRIHRFLKKGRKYKSLYGSSILATYRKFIDKKNCDYYAFYPHHNIDSYRKSLFLDCINCFQEEFEETLNHKFRQFNDIQRIIISLWCLSEEKAILKKSRRSFIQKLFNLEAESTMYSLKGKNLPRLAEINTKLMCINDNQRTTKKDRQMLKQVLEEKFWEKSSFEK